MQVATDPLKVYGEEKLYSSAFMEYKRFSKECNVSWGNAKVFQANKVCQGNVKVLQANAAAFFGGAQNFGRRMQRFSGEY